MLDLKFPVENLGVSKAGVLGATGVHKVIHQLLQLMLESPSTSDAPKCCKIGLSPIPRLCSKSFQSPSPHFPLGPWRPAGMHKQTVCIAARQPFGPVQG